MYDPTYTPEVQTIDRLLVLEFERMVGALGVYRNREQEGRCACGGEWRAYVRTDTGYSVIAHVARGDWPTCHGIGVAASNWQDVWALARQAGQADLIVYLWERIREVTQCQTSIPDARNRVLISNGPQS